MPHYQLLALMWLPALARERRSACPAFLRLIYVVRHEVKMTGVARRWPAGGQMHDMIAAGIDTFHFVYRAYFRSGWVNIDFPFSP